MSNFKFRFSGMQQKAFLKKLIKKATFTNTPLKSSQLESIVKNSRQFEKEKKDFQRLKR